jgi:hypothetical protein
MSEFEFYDLNNFTLEDVKNLTIIKQLKILTSLARGGRSYCSVIDNEHIQEIIEYMLINISNKKIYYKRLGIIISHILNNSCTQDKLKWIDLLTKAKPKLDLTVNNSKIIIGPKCLVNLLFFIVKKPYGDKSLTEDETIKYYEKLLSWISNITDINKLDVIDNHLGKINFLSHWLSDNLYYNQLKESVESDLLYVVFKNDGKYGINLSQNVNFLKTFFWPCSIIADDKKTLLKTLRKEVVKMMPLSFFNQTYLHAYQDKKKVIDLIIHYSFFELINEVKNRIDLVNIEISTSSILSNIFINTNEKKSLINFFTNLNNEITFKNFIKLLKSQSFSALKDFTDYFDFCKNNLNIINTINNKDNLYHELAKLNYFERFNLIEIEDYIFSLNMEVNNINEKNHKGQYPIHYLALISQIEKYESSISSPYFSDRNAFLSKKKKIPEIIQQFKLRNVNFNAQNKLGNTVSHIAAKTNNALISKFIEAGADLTIKNKFGKTAINYLNTKNEANKEFNDFVFSVYEKQLLEKACIQSNELVKKNTKV